MQREPSLTLLELEIPGLPSCNSAAALGWRVRHAERKAWKGRVSNAVLCKLGRWPSTPLDRARVTLTRCSSVEPDADNLASSFKFILDGLVMAGVIADDKPSVIDVDFRWERAPRGAGCVRIRVETLAAVAAHSEMLCGPQGGTARGVEIGPKVSTAQQTAQQGDPS